MSPKEAEYDELKHFCLHCNPEDFPEIFIRAEKLLRDHPNSYLPHPEDFDGLMRLEAWVELAYRFAPRFIAPTVVPVSITMTSLNAVIKMSPGLGTISSEGTCAPLALLRASLLAYEMTEPK